MPLARSYIFPIALLVFHAAPCVLLVSRRRRLFSRPVFRSLRFRRINKDESALSTFPYIPCIDDRFVDCLEVGGALAETPLDRLYGDTMTAGFENRGTGDLVGIDEFESHFV